MIERKKKTCKECGNEDYIFGHGLCKKCYNINMAKSKNRHKNRNTTKHTHSTSPTSSKEKKLTITVQSKIKTADDLFSQIVRRRAAYFNNTVDCYTCGINLPFSAIHCGHFQPRGNHSTRWVLENGKPQCPTCNVELRGNIEVFEQKLEQEMPGITDFLRQLAREPLRITSSVLDETIEGLRQILKEIEKD
jgi:hypothetical protein